MRLNDRSLRAGRSWNTPMWAAPRAPPPLSARPIFGREFCAARSICFRPELGGKCGLAHCCKPDSVLHLYILLTCWCKESDP